MYKNSNSSGSKRSISWPKELIYTKTGRVGFNRTETDGEITIQLGPNSAMTIPKSEIDHRVSLD